MILCCGESLIDMLPRQLTGGEDVFLPVAGGAIFNTAITLGRLGLECGLISGISTDMFGEQLIDCLNDSNVSIEYCVRSSHPTTLAFVKLIHGDAQYSFLDENSASRMLTHSDILPLSKAVEAMQFGAISLIAEPSGTTLERLMADNRDGPVVSLDPNIRPGFITDAEAHRGRINRMIAMSDIVKVSEEDLRWIQPDTEPGTAAHLLSQNGPNLLVVTKGASGADIFFNEEIFSVEAPQVKVMDTIGAGDSFNGGLLAGLKQSGLLSKHALACASMADLKTAVEFAVKVAALTVSKIGANPPWADELQKFDQPH